MRYATVSPKEYIAVTVDEGNEDWIVQERSWCFLYLSVVIHVLEMMM